MMRFSGKKVWLVGASEGIGAEVAKLLAAEGAQLTLSARNEVKLKELVASLPGAGHLALPVDVTNEATVALAWEAVAKRGGADVVIYNAGTYTPISAKAFDLKTVQGMVDVNFLGALRVLGSVLPPIVEKKAGHIVLVASVAAYRGLPRAMGYGASKAALYQTAENLAIDLDGMGIKVQVVCPGFVKTRLTDQNDFKMPFIINAAVAAKRIVDGMAGNGFEIHFPKRFSLILKTLRLLPNRLYLALAKRL